MIKIFFALITLFNLLSCTSNNHKIQILQNFKTEIQLISGNLIEPRIMGESANLHPVTILLALMFWGTIWGIVGMFLATPITAVIRIGLERIPFTQSLAMLMAGQIPED